MSTPLIRFLRKKLDRNDVYIWHELLARNTEDFEEIFAVSASDARLFGVKLEGDQVPNLQLMTKAQIAAWAEAKLQVKLDLKKNTHAELVERVKALLDERAGDSVDHSGVGSTSTCLE